MKAVDVLRDLDEIEHAATVDVFGKWKLDENAVNGRVGVEQPHGPDELVLTNGPRELVKPTPHADLVRRFLLVSCVHDARRVFAHQHDIESGNATVLGKKRLHAVSHFRPNGCGQSLSVDDARRHERRSLQRNLGRVTRSAPAYEVNE